MKLIILQDIAWLFKLLIKDAQKLFFVLMISLLFMALSQGAILFLLKPFLSLLFGSHSAVNIIKLSEILPSGMQKFAILDHITLQKKAVITWVPIFILFAGLIRLLAIFFYNYYQQKIVLRFSLRLREKYFKQIISQDYLSFKKHPVGYFNAIVINNVENLKQRMSDFFISMFKDIVLILSGVGFLFIIHPLSAAAILLVSPFLGYLMGKAGSKIAFFARRSQEEVSRIGGEMTFLRQKLVFIRLQNGYELENQNFSRINKAYIFAMLKTVVLRSVFAPVIELLGVFLVAFLFFRYGLNKNGTEVDSVIFIQFIAALGLILKSLVSFGSQIASASDFWGTLRHASMTLGQFSAPSVMNHKIEEKITGMPDKEVAINSVLFIDRMEHRFSGGGLALRVNSLSVKPGSTIAVIGTNGAGKSTFLKILSGIIEPDNWVASNSWQSFTRDKVSYVSQEPFVFEESVQNNLSYASEIPVGPEKIYGVLELIDLKNKVWELPEKLDTVMRNFRQNFSGGEVQRLSIARSLLRMEKEIFLFDEVTASLDVQTEKFVLKNIFTTLKPHGKVVVMVTHRLDQLNLFDRVLFFHEGKIIFDGPPQDIISFKEFVALKSELETQENGV